MEQKNNVQESVYQLLETLNLKSIHICNTTVVTEKVIPGLMVISNQEFFDYFNLNIDLNISPKYIFRLINLDKKMYVLEFTFEFFNNTYMKFHLNPKSKYVDDFIQRLILEEFISLHFFNKDTDQILSIYFDIKEEKEWLMKNYFIIKSLKSNPDFKELSKHIILKQKESNYTYLVQDTKMKFIEM